MAFAIILEIVACFLLSIALLHRYCDMVNSNIVTVVGVFISWFFSFLVIFLLPADLTSTAYRSCLNTTQSLNVSRLHINSTNQAQLSSQVFDTTIASIIDHNSVPTLSNSTINELTSIHNFNNIHLDEQNSTTNGTNSTTDRKCTPPWNLVPKNSLILAWRFIYWTSQFLTWLLLPIMQSYSKAGEFSTGNKLKSALRANFIYYSSFGAIFTVLLIYVIIRNGFITFSNLRVILVASSNTWGLFLLVVLLGYGLVELPRFLIDRSRYSQYLNRLYFNVASTNAEKCEAEERLDDVLDEIQLAMDAIGASEFNYLKQCLNKIVDRCPEDMKRRLNVIRRQTSASNSNYQPSNYADYDIQTMIVLNRKVINAVHRHGQAMCKWRHIIKEVIEWEDVAKNQTDHEALATRMFRSSIPKEKSILSRIFTPKVEWYWKCLIRVWMLRASGLLMTVFSLAVVWSEIAFPFSIFSTKLSVFALFMDGFEASQKYFGLELFSIISIGYLAVCAFYTVFHMKIFNIYYLAPNKQTDEYSLLFSGMLLCRLTAPLCLNYLCLVHRDSRSSEQTSFTTIMGHLDLLPIVNKGLNVFLPLCISAICLAIYFNVGSHFLHGLGFEIFIEDDELTIDLIQTGRDLVKREKGKLMRLYDPSGSRREVTSREQIDAEQDRALFIS